MADYVTKIRTDAGDLQIDYNALANLPGNPNLLINSNFRNPVNQRWKTTYNGGEENKTTNALYTIDRWLKRNYGSTIVVGDGYVRFQCDSEPSDSGTQTYAFVQPIEYPHLMLGNTYTISAKVKSINGSFMLGMWQGAQAGFVSNSISGDVACKEILTAGVHFITLTVEQSFSNDCSVINVGFTQSSGQHRIGDYIDIEWVKLECGSVATPFLPRLRAEEVNLCKRYYQFVNPYRLPFVVISNEKANGTIPLGVSMRDVPTVEITSCTYLENNAQNNRVPADFKVNEAGTTNQCVEFQITKNNSSTFNEGNVKLGVITASFDAEIY